MKFKCDILTVEVKEINGILTKEITLDPEKMRKEKIKRIPCSKYKNECKTCLALIPVTELKEKGWSG
jgi:hypothetical protein